MLGKLIKYAALSIIALTAVITITLDKSAAKSAYEEQNPALYTLKEYDGKIAVYKYNSKIPQEVLDVYVESLPEADKIQLKTGVVAQNIEQLNRLIEDYDG